MPPPLMSHTLSHTVLQVRQWRSLNQEDGSAMLCDGYSGLPCTGSHVSDLFQLLEQEVHQFRKLNKSISVKIP